MFAGGRCGQQALGQDDLCSEIWTEAAMIRGADPIEAVAWSDNPCILRWAAEIAAKVLEDSRIRGSDRGEVIEGLVGACRQ